MGKVTRFAEIPKCCNNTADVPCYFISLVEILFWSTSSLLIASTGHTSTDDSWAK